MNRKPIVDAAELAELLAARDPEERRRAIARVAAGWNAGVLPLFIAALADDSWRVRKEVVRRIVEWPDREGTVTALIGVLGEEDDVGMRNAAVEALVRIGQPAVAPLILALRAGGAHRKFLIDALGAIGLRDAEAALLEMLRDPDLNLQVAAVEALGFIGGPQAETALLELLDTPAELLRLAALDGLRRTGCVVPLERLAPSLAAPLLRKNAVRLAGASCDPRAIAAIADAICDGPRRIREAGIDAAASLISALGQAERTAELAEVVAALRRLGPTLAEALASALVSDDPELLRAAAAIAGAAGVVEVVPQLAARLLDPAVSEEVAEALRELGPQATEALVAVARDGDSELRSELFLLIASIGLRDPRVEALLVESLEVSDPAAEQAAANAARALGELGFVSAVPVLLDLLDAASCPELTSAVLMALAKLGTEPGTAARVEQALERALGSGEQDVRAAAALALGEMGRPAAREILADRLGDDDAYVRLAVVRALGNFGEGSAGLLRAQLGREDDAVVAETIRSLLRAGAR
jgi:HEAT repeat protein